MQLAMLGDGRIGAIMVRDQPQGPANVRLDRRIAALLVQFLMREEETRNMRPMDGFGGPDDDQDYDEEDDFADDGFNPEEWGLSGGGGDGAFAPAEDYADLMDSYGQWGMGDDDDDELDAINDPEIRADPLFIADLRDPVKQALAPFAGLLTEEERRFLSS